MLKHDWSYHLTYIHVSSARGSRAGAMVSLEWAPCFQCKFQVGSTKKGVRRKGVSQATLCCLSFWLIGVFFLLLLLWLCLWFCFILNYWMCLLCLKFEGWNERRLSGSLVNWWWRFCQAIVDTVNGSVTGGKGVPLWKRFWTWGFAFTLNKLHHQQANPLSFQQNFHCAPFRIRIPSNTIYIHSCAPVFWLCWLETPQTSSQLG